MAEVWIENLPTVNVFIAMSTQWRIGMSGPTGLDYSALPAVLRLTGIARNQWTDVFDGLREMEEAALECIHEKKK